MSRKPYPAWAVSTPLSGDAAQRQQLKLGSYPAREVSSVRIRDINCAVILECSDGDVIS